MRLLLLITLALLSPIVYSNDWFSENIGQVKNQLGESNSDVLYIFNSSDFTVTLRKQGFSYELKRIVNQSGDIKDPVREFTFNAAIERIDFELPNKPDKIIVGLKSNYYTNLYNNLGSFEDIPHYRKITYKEVFPGIDIEFIIEKGQFKYNVIAQPEADLSEFHFKINSDKSPSLNQNDLVLNTTNGKITENIPLSYLKQSKEKIQVNYKLENRKLYFIPDKVTKDKTLIIDPVPDLIWNTYFGGSQFDLVNDIEQYDNDKFYQTGFTMSLDNISTSDAFLANYQGDLDAFVSKFDTDGNIIWSTYYGGPQTERVYSIALDSLGNSYIAGSSFSTTGIATTGTHQEYLDGADDIFILKLFSNGQRDWCTYHGGNGHDFITDMKVVNDTIFSVGHTTSTNNLSSPGAHMENNTTNEAGHISLFSTNGDFLWGTYFGDGGNNSIEGLAVNDNYIYITGRTNNATGISTSGAHQESLTGFVDGFISKFNKEGAQIWGTYFGGDYSDKSKSISLDEKGDIYICGDASSLNQISTPGAYQENRLSGEQGFLSKFNSDGQQLWGSYTGGYNSDYVHKIVYRNGYLYLGGQTLSETEIVSADGLQQTKSDGFDVFIQKFDTTGSFEWGTYFGNSSNEDLSSIDVSTNDQILISGNCDASSANFTTENAFQQGFGGGSSDGFLTHLCQPVKPEIVYSEGELISTWADEYQWYFEGILLNETTQSISPNSDGEYVVVTSNNGLCTDTSEVFLYSSVNLESESENSLKVYPNPANSHLNIESKGFTSVSIKDINNKIILRKSGSDNLNLDLASLSRGIYIVQIENDNSLIIKKVIKN